ncbi:MAG TPA: hypothetical protein VMM76_04825 [Pirellulaceae bacterium]|nr:hypothetical protein [Pirellulaceae bacterium]
MDSDRKFWPFQPRVGILCTVVLLVLLLPAVAVLHTKLDWPSEKYETAGYVVAIVLSSLPMILALLDVFIERGGTIEYGSVKIALSRMSQIGMPDVIVPVNIGIPGRAVADSGSHEILDALKRATSCEFVIVDLEDGQAWWETRLLVLVAGAQRIGKPGKILFVGDEDGKEHQFLGWAEPHDVLPRLLQASRIYRQSFYASQAAARQWEMVETQLPVEDHQPGTVPAKPEWINCGLALNYQGMAFDNDTGLPNKLLAEQLLQNELGSKIERLAGPRNVSTARLDDLFGPLLHKDRIDQNWPVQQQLEAFFASDAPYIAITQDGKYSTFVSRFTMLNEMLRTIIQKK